MNGVTFDTGKTLIFLSREPIESAGHKNNVTINFCVTIFHGKNVLNWDAIFEIRAVVSSLENSLNDMFSTGFEYLKKC